MSRKAKKDDTGSKKNSSLTLPKRRIVIVKEDLLDSDSDQNPTFVQLRHPSSGKAATFLFSADDTKVNEVMQFSDPKRSYFIDQSVCSDGDVYFCTPIDPLFLVLPYLMKADRCSPLDQTLLDEELPDIARLSACPMDVTLIADRRGLESLNAFVYNEDKTLLWLQTKLERLIPVLRQKTVNTSKNVAVSANFVKIGEEEDSNANYLRYAYGLLCDYIPEDLVAKFADFIKLPPELERVSKRKEIVSPSKPDGKKVKLDDVDEAYEAKTPVSKAEKRNFCSAFGEYLALKLATYNLRTRSQVEFEISKILHQADMQSFHKNLTDMNVADRSTDGQIAKTPSAKEQALAKAAKGSKSISSFFKKK